MIGRRVLDGFAEIIERLPKPQSWPAPMRKVFLLGLPITLPIWCMLMAVWLGLVMLMMVLGAAVLLIVGVWKGEDRFR